MSSTIGRVPSWSLASDVTTMISASTAAGLLAGLIMGYAQSTILATTSDGFDPSIWIFYAIYAGVTRASLLGLASKQSVLLSHKHLAILAGAAYVAMYPFLLPIETVMPGMPVPYITAALYVVAIAVAAYLVEYYISGLWRAEYSLLRRLRSLRVGRVGIGRPILLMVPIYFGSFGIYYRSTTGLGTLNVAPVILCGLLALASILLESESTGPSASSSRG